MPKLGMPPVRRKALIDAAIAAVGARGTLDVTMSEIAGLAGVSPALAHHYFGGKSDLLQASMQHLLSELGREASAALQAAGPDPLKRILAIVAVNLSGQQFAPATISAWLAFFGEAQHSAPMRRLLSIYTRRLHSNLMSGFTGLMPRREAAAAAETIGALIDGLYLRRALNPRLSETSDPAGLVEACVRRLAKVARS